MKQRGFLFDFSLGKDETTNLPFSGNTKNINDLPVQVSEFRLLHPEPSIENILTRGYIMDTSPTAAGKGRGGARTRADSAAAFPTPGGAHGLQRPVRCFD